MVLSLLFTALILPPPLPFPPATASKRWKSQKNDRLKIERKMISKMELDVLFTESKSSASARTYPWDRQPYRLPPSGRQNHLLPYHSVLCHPLKANFSRQKRKLRRSFCFAAQSYYLLIDPKPKSKRSTMNIVKLALSRSSVQGYLRTSQSD
jgi:hypothetical protein